MTDFIARQIARADGRPSSSVKPRLPSFFEPVPAAGAVPVSELGSPVPRPAIPQAEPPAPPADPDGEGPSLPLVARPVPPPGLERARLAAPFAATVEPGPLAGAAVAGPLAVAAIGAPRPSRVTPPLASDDPLEARPVTGVPERPPAPGAPPALAPAPAWRRTPDLPDEDPAPAHGAAGVRWRTPALVAQVPPPAASTAASPPSRPPAQVRTSASRPAPEPIIDVTIGRIEIRATSAPASPRRPRPPNELESYLRDKGGRRP